jgi:2-polyprenyl-3-methyl-5-hydroxy-6-metoxy-1,4-benzoquinol methylase
VNIFDSLAKEWDQNSNRVKNAKTLYEKLDSLLDLEGKRVIDYGAGSGLLSTLLAQKACEVLALDSSKKMLEQIDKKIKDHKIPNITTLHHDILKDELPKNYDLFVSSMTLHHIEDTKDFFIKAKSSLKKGGHIALLDLCSEDGSFHSRGNDGVYHFGFDMEELGGLCEELGLDLIFLDEIYQIKKEKNYPIFLLVARV